MVMSFGKSGNLHFEASVNGIFKEEAATDDTYCADEDERTKDRIAQRDDPIALYLSLHEIIIYPLPSSLKGYQSWQ